MADHSDEHARHEFNSSFPAMPADKLPLAPQTAGTPLPAMKPQTSFHAKTSVHGDTSQRSQPSIHAKSPANGNTSQRSQTSLRDKSPVHGNASQRSQPPLYANSPVHREASHQSQPPLHSKPPVHGNTSQRSQTSLRDKSPVHGDVSRQSQTSIHAKSPSHKEGSQHAATPLHAKSPSHKEGSQHAATPLHAKSPSHKEGSQHAATPLHGKTPVNGSFSQHAATPLHAKSPSHKEGSQHAATPLHAKSPSHKEGSQHAATPLHAKSPSHKEGSQHAATPLHGKTPVNGSFAHQSQTPLRGKSSSQVQTPLASGQAPGTPQSNRTDSEAQLRQKRAERVRAILEGYQLDAASLPSLQALREKRVGLIEEVRHHKDEQDSLSLNIEGLEGASELYNTAARLQRLEAFVQASNTYVNEVLPGEVERFLEDDKKRSEEEISAYAQELQSKRDRVMQRAAEAEERTKKLSTHAQKYVDPEEDENTKITIAHVDGNVNEIALLDEKVKKFRTLKSKLLAEAAREKKNDAGVEKSLNIQIKNAELGNARDIRISKELNLSNASLTANVQMLMNQLNAEHYGVDNAPTVAQLAEGYEQRMLMLEKTPVNARESVPSAERSVREPSHKGVAATNSVASCEKKALSTPLKRMESQGSRRSGALEKVSQPPSERISAASQGRLNGSRHGSVSPSRASEKPIKSVRSYSNVDEQAPKSALVC